MNQPFLWGGLLAFAVAAGSVRLVVGRPLLRRRSVRVSQVGAAVAFVSGLALVFHCAAMFFGPWIDAVPFLQAPADMVRARGVGSEIAYWAPAAALVVAWRRVWWPALAAIVITLAGVGVTMFWPYPLVVHLVWLTAVIIIGSLIPTLLLRGPRTAR
ncbi:hypothetical protein [Cryobacterium psychrophilum]|uniref:Uncharacterized protein n=1 Tax=Cryobacterium psychrophilum TaxID=41988 RepID=A0A4Y8KR24_9MICO|nr:hypothetical protein [Cryobacterium psychrophilum]TDW30119.1 hypothetical protein EDD25_1860 [Cryobacterium psychrophilum]TFD79885.1 hypothetical protein E3T53_06445 [Cryobacterium psychrophilum]